jgi:hypothetical protein
MAARDMMSPAFQTSFEEAAEEAVQKFVTRKVEALKTLNVSLPELEAHSYAAAG